MLARSSNSSLSHVSRAVRELADRGLVECMNQDAAKNRFYRITDKGRSLIKELEVLEKDHRDE